MITAEEIESEIQKLDMEQIKEMETLIDQELKKKWTGKKGLDVSILLSKHATERMANKLIAMYQEVGWNVLDERRYDGRYDARFVLVFSKR